MMEDRELQRLKRGDLLELLLEQSKINDSLQVILAEKEEKIQELTKKLENRMIDLDKAGTIADASFKLNGIFEAAENAAKQYLENLEALYEKEKNIIDKKEELTENKCSAMLQAMIERCEFMKESTLKQCEEIETSVQKRCDELITSTETRCRDREKESEERCIALDQKAKSDVDKRWNELSNRLEKFYSEHTGLRELLSISGEL